jgi:hypothetical protein
MTFEDFIPPRSKSVLEITGEIPADFESTKENFLEIQPDCNYTVSKDFSNSDESFDAILFQSAAFGNLENKKLIELIQNAAKKIKSAWQINFHFGQYRLR